MPRAYTGGEYSRLGVNWVGEVGGEHFSLSKKIEPVPVRARARACPCPIYRIFSDTGTHTGMGTKFFINRGYF